MGAPLEKAPKFYTAASLGARHDAALVRQSEIDDIPRHLKPLNYVDELADLGHLIGVLGPLRDSAQILAKVLGEDVAFPAPSIRVARSTMSRAIDSGLTPLLRPSFPDIDTVRHVVNDRSPHILKTVYTKPLLAGIAEERVPKPDTQGLMWVDQPGTKTTFSVKLGIHNLAEYTGDPERLLEDIKDKKESVLIGLHMPPDADIQIATPDVLALLNAMGQPAEGATGIRATDTGEQIIFRRGQIATRNAGDPDPIPPRLVIVLGAHQQATEEGQASE